ncbi:hypothetical protein V1264_002732 [Littorina saxatilis]|uniref:Beta-sarcoglycan n=2 Tax=Littorina saxatilis TaxID=31220 RepID=A0AAN9B3W8_9CAEN
MIRFSIDDLKLMTLSGRQYFSLADMKIAGLKNVKNLHVEELQTRQVKNAPNYDDLMIESWNQTNITGCLGVQATSGRETDITAQNVYISSLNGSTVLDGLVGMYISTSIPQVNDNLPINHNIINSKICVCRQSGRVFVVPVSKPGMGCATANELVNPCQM